MRELLRVALRFWGSRPSGHDPKNLMIDGEPYHHLRLLDPIRESDWLLKYERWLDARRVLVSKTTRKTRPLTAQTKNHYLSIMSRPYETAMRPEYVKTTGVTANPFTTMERHRARRRRVAVTPEELRRWLAHTPRHAQLAIAIAALAPKLRMRNVLELRWDTSFDAHLTYITVADHKTVGLTGEPLVVPISDALRGLLEAAQRTTKSEHVVTYRGKPVRSIRGSVRAGAEAAGVTYGLTRGGVTFHAIRHTAATLLAELPGLTEAQRSETMGQDILTTQIYTHLRPASRRAVLEQLADLLSLKALLTAAFGPPAAKPAVPVSDASGSAE